MNAAGKSAAPSVVFDTAVILHALLLNDETARRLRSAWQSGGCQALIAKSSARALIDALRYPALSLNEMQQQELLTDFLPYAQVLSLEAVKVSPTQKKILTDRTGQVLSPAILELMVAAEGKVQYFVSDSSNSSPARKGRGKPSDVSFCRILDTASFLALQQG
ncbi:PIN domain-containing protein [Roseateles koreensis]|uniref:PIN domain-containing protein n=1 Tax=Roseateles koreensis TaxID=2987526 RepID=A0ABT5KUA5_9BURK|nr:PIN domain-containing protein [Roseateles koreensis]MDC8786528.1 PIN domain-containing protein [Roseateles koreensis]